MTITRDMLLDRLPPYVGASIVITQDQDVKDIIREILDAHSSFTSYYDRLAPYFEADTVAEICDGLQRFCVGEIEYREESRHDQTTALPTGILHNGFGDCKHYASFCGGILSAISRTTGKKINWCYRFVSYKILEPTPYHVFVVVFDRGRQIWIDPTPGAEKMTPVWIVDKYVKNITTMPLRRIISGFNSVGDLVDSDRDTSIYGIGVVDPATILAAVQTVIKFVNVLAADKVPNYPIKTTDTLNKIVAEIGQLLPMPPTSVANAQQLLADAKALQAPLAGDQDNVRKTYFLIYGEIIRALETYISQRGGSTQVNIDPATGLPRIEPRTAGDFFSNNKTLLLLAGAGVVGWYFLKKGRARSVHGVEKQLLPVALGAGVIYFIIKKNGTRTKRQYLTDWGAGESGAEKFALMTDSEINSVYDYVTGYINQGLTLPQGSKLWTEINAISAKYDIFT